MNSPAQFESKGHTLFIKGKVNVHNITILQEKFKAHLIDEIHEIDCSQIREADSSAISFLLACLRQAHKRKRELSITGMGEQLLNLASLYGVEQLLEERSS